MFDKYRFGDVGALLNRSKWLRLKPALTNADLTSDAGPKSRRGKFNDCGTGDDAKMISNDFDVISPPSTVGD